MQDKHFAAIRKRLARLETLGHACDETDNRIRASAEDRRGQVQDELARLAPRAHLDSAAADKYLELVDERRHLDRVLGAGS